MQNVIKRKQFRLFAFLFINANANNVQLIHIVKL